MTKPIYTYTSIHIKEAYYFEQLLENILKGIGIHISAKTSIWNLKPINLL